MGHGEEKCEGWEVVVQTPPQALEIVLHSTDWILEAVYKCEVTKGFEVQGLTQAGVI